MARVRCCLVQYSSTEPHELARLVERKMDRDWLRGRYVCRSL